MWSAERQPRHRCDSHTHSTRSIAVKRTRGRRARFAIANWWQSARTSKCSDARERTKNRNDWSSETTISTMSRAYSEWPASSIAATCTAFLVATRCTRSVFSSVSDSGALRRGHVDHSRPVRRGIADALQHRATPIKALLTWAEPCTNVQMCVSTHVRAAPCRSGARSRTASSDSIH
jgi:hypothetical protein